MDRKSQVTTSTYDALNRRTKATYHDSTSTNYTYDAGNRITQVQEKNAGGTVTATITRTYDGLDRSIQCKRRTAAHLCSICEACHQRLVPFSVWKGGDVLSARKTRFPQARHS